MQLLEAIGVITKSARKKASGCSGDSYQETVAVPMSRAHDIDGEGDDDEADADDGTQLKSVQKVSSTLLLGYV
jgi:hypothetical protein